MSFTIQIEPTDAGRMRAEPDDCFWIVEVDGHDSVPTLTAALSEGAVVSGHVVISSRTETPGVRLVRERRPIAFTAAAVARISIPTWRIVERDAA